MKNHEWVDGKLLQTNKKYSHLKQKQKDKIYQWMYEAFKHNYDRTGRYPGRKEDDEILFEVMDRIESAEIWIPEHEVEKHYKSVKSKLNKRYKRSVRESIAAKVTLEPLDVDLSVCKVEDYSGVDISRPYCFTGATDEELSLVCPTELVPDNTTAREDGWKAFRIIGVLDFSLIGILARISKILASNGIGIFAISTFNTDYILMKQENYDAGLKALKNSGYTIMMPDDTETGVQGAIDESI